METTTTASPAYLSNPLQLLRPSWRAFKLVWINILLLGLCLIGVIAVPFALYFLASLAHGGNLVDVLITLLALPWLFYTFTAAGWTAVKITIAAARGQRLKFREILPPRWTDPLKFFVTSLLTGLAIIIGLILLIVPGILAMSWYSFAPYITVDEGTWGWSALKQSRELMRGRTWDMLGTLFLRQAIAIVLIVPILGIIVYLILMLIIVPLMAVRYDSLRVLKQQPDWQAVPTSRWNYAVFIVGLVIGAFLQITNFQQIQHNATAPALDKQTY